METNIFALKNGKVAKKSVITKRARGVISSILARILLNSTADMKKNMKIKILCR